MTVTEPNHAPSFFGRAANPELVQRAQARIEQRRAREVHLPGVIFGEAAWEILLQLFVHDAYGPIAASKIADLIQTPLTTALRWVAYLEGQNLVESREDPLDARRRRLVLSSKGIECLSQILGD